MIGKILGRHWLVPARFFAPDWGDQRGETSGSVRDDEQSYLFTINLGILGASFHERVSLQLTPLDDSRSPSRCFARQLLRCQQRPSLVGHCLDRLIFSRTASTIAAMNASPKIEEDGVLIGLFPIPAGPHCYAGIQIYWKQTRTSHRINGLFCCHRK